MCSINTRWRNLCFIKHIDTDSSIVYMRPVAKSIVAKALKL